MLQLKQHLFCVFFFPKNDVMCLHYYVIHHPLHISSQYLKMWGVDSPAWPQSSKMLELLALI